MEIKQCSKCKEIKSINEFNKNIIKKDNLSTWCKTCNKEQNKEWHVKNKAIVNPKKSAYARLNREKINKRHNEWIRENPLTSLLYQTKTRAKQKNFEFNLDLEYLESIKVQYCPIFDIELDYTIDNKISNNRASLDRIDNSKGYIKGNVAWISFRANTLKSNTTADELQKLATYAKGVLNV